MQSIRVRVLFLSVARWYKHSGIGTRCARYRLPFRPNVCAFTRTIDEN
jgi:hypothetical protein